MTLRAFALGLLGAALVCGVTYFNDGVMHQTYVVGNNMPISVYGSLVIFLLLINPLLGRVGKKATLSGRELTVVLALTLAACCIPGSGLMRTFPSSLILPHHLAKTEAGWQEQEVMDLTPERMLVAADDDSSSDVLNGFIQGLGVGGAHIRITDVPWRAWARPLCFWLPLILSLWVALIGLSLVVHRQWSEHEQLPYPIAQFVSSLLPLKEGETRGSVFHERLFWWGLGVVFVIHLNNYGCTWFPERMLQVPLKFDFWSLSSVFPTVRRGGGWFAFSPTLYLTVIAFSFFLAADVSLSLGIGPIIYAYIAGLLAIGGIQLAGGGYLALKPQTFLNFGAYAGLFLGLLFTGRFYYVNVFKGAVGLKTSSETEQYAVWGARLFLVCTLVFIGNLTMAGLDWQLATFYAVGILMIFLVMGRILAETGLFFIQPTTFPCIILWGVFGAKALGPQTMLILLFVTTVLLIDPRESLMPFIVNSLKTVDMRQMRVGRTAGACIAAIVVGLLVAIPVQLYLQYDLGANMADRWANDVVPKFAFQETVRVKQRLDAQDSLESAELLAGWSRFGDMAPDAALLGAFAAGLALVLVFTACRLRFPKWPLHPVMFLVWNSFPAKMFAASFLLGCLIKSVVTKYGGPSAYQRLKPLMFGIIAGDMLGGIVPSIIGLLYYAITGEIPKSFSIMPG